MSFDPGVFDPLVFGSAAGEPSLFDGAIFDSAVFDVGEDGEVEPAPTAIASPVAGGGKSRRIRSFVELEGRLVEVSGYAEAEKLVSALKKEEKAQENDRKKLRVIFRKSAEKSEPVGLYAQQEKIEAIERQMDDRADRIALLYAMIQRNLENEITADDEEVMLLS